MALTPAVLRSITINKVRKYVEGHSQFYHYLSASSLVEQPPTLMENASECSEPIERIPSVTDSRATIHSLCKEIECEGRC